MVSFFKRKAPGGVQPSSEQTFEQSSTKSSDEKDESSAGRSDIDNVGELDYNVSGDTSRLSRTSRQTAFQIMADTLFHYADGQRLFSDNPMVWNGVALRLSKGQYVCAPQHDPRLQPCMQALQILNVPAVVTVTSTVVAGIVASLSPSAYEIAITPEDRIQVLESMDELASARKAQGAAFIRSEARVLVWTDKVDDLISTARQFEAQLVHYVWNHMSGNSSPGNTSFSGQAPKDASAAPVAGVRTGPGGERLVTTKVFDEKNPEDPEKLETHQERNTVYIAPTLHGLAIALDLLICSLVLRKLAIETAYDGNYMRWAIAAATPGLFIIILFFSDNIIGGLCMLLGPIRQMNVNSRYYSSVAPERMTGTLPHITIQMPVYKESLDGVLAPTIESIKKAIQTYELQGGSAGILVSEDGLLLVDEEERNKRLEYYDLHQVAWVARPGHNVDGYIRKGRFKKASNLNFTCALSLAVERIMMEQRPVVTDGDALQVWSQQEEDALYQQALAQALTEVHPLAQASGNIRIGELVLMIDCDTRVPEDCFLDAASEMTQCPEVAILQHCSGVMLVSENNYFERGIGFDGGACARWTLLIPLLLWRRFLNGALKASPSSHAYYTTIPTLTSSFFHGLKGLTSGAVTLS